MSVKEISIESKIIKKNNKDYPKECLVLKEISEKVSKIVAEIF